MLRQSSKILLLTGLWLLPIPCQRVLVGQEIVAIVGANGKKVYSNLEGEATAGEVIIKSAAPASATSKTPSTTPPPHIEKMIDQISQQHGVDPALVKAVAKVESNFNPYAVSYKGARGMMQLIPGTAKRFGVRNVFDPQQNIEGGVKYLKTLSEMFPDNIGNVLAAYNAGENSVLRHGGIPPFRETQNYVKSILRIYQIDGKKGTTETAGNELEKGISRYLDPSGRVVYSNLEGN